jgi:hypothetical protein
MRNRLLARGLIGPALLLALAPGCLALPRPRPVGVLARNAETKQPIPGAEVRISYAPTPSPLAPSDSSGTTGGDGIARMRATPYGDAGVVVEVAAKGYLSEEKVLPVEAVAALAPAGLFEAVERRPASVVVELYAEPRPTVELVVPAGYRGPVKVAIQARDDVPCPPGQRCFRYAVPDSGVVEATGPALLRRVFPPEFRARSAGGAELSGRSGEAGCGLWWLRDEDGYHVFLVGTRAEYEEALRSERPSAGGEGRSPAGKREGGRGRGGRRGSQAPADASPSG